MTLSKLVSADRRQPERAIKVLIAGGGPSALLHALTLDHLMGARADITVQDARWIEAGSGVRWKGAQEGAKRRRQVVTMQSQVWGAIPAPIREAMFVEGGFSEIWPLAAESPVSIGYPRNIRICDLEDRLLELARSTRITLRAERVVAEEICTEDWDLIVCCDGASSATREHFSERFGVGDPTPYSIDGHQVKDTILAIRVEPALRDVDMVPLTVAQNRFLYNGLGGSEREGYLYMRLTTEEAAEAHGLVDGVKQPCTQGAPCGIGTSAAVQFAPANDPESKLWPRVVDGLSLYGMTQEDVLDMLSFELSMVARPRAVAEVSQVGASRQTFAVLCGDAASAVHFWPGRGLNGGASMATALAHVLAKTWTGKGLRAADLALYEASFAAIRHRHADRAWRAFAQPGPDGLEAVHSVIAQAMASEDGARSQLKADLVDRVRQIADRLSGRTPEPVDLADVLRCIDRVSTETLRVLVESKPWETRASGGPEVDILRLVA